MADYEGCFAYAREYENGRETLVCDPRAKLTHGCQVVVRYDGIAFEGTVLNKRPVTFRRLLIGYGHGQRAWIGPRDPDYVLGRVVGICRDI